MSPERGDRGGEQRHVVMPSGNMLDDGTLNRIVRTNCDAWAGI